MTDCSDAPQRRSIVARLWSRNALVLLTRNTIVGTGVFIFDLALLWVLVDRVGMGKVTAATIAFIAANSLHYVFGRTWIFRGTERGVTSGYVLFLFNAGVGLVVTIGLFAAAIHWTSINYVVARTLVSVVAGLVTFLLNAMLNFRKL